MEAQFWRDAFDFLVAYDVPFGLILALTGFLVAFRSERRNARERRPTYTYSSRTIIEAPAAAPSEIQVLFRGEPQPRVTVTKLAFWNAGELTLDTSHVVADRPLEILVHSDARVLDSRIELATDSSNRVLLGPPRAEADFTAIPITFDYLDKHEGARIVLVHTGTDLTKIKLVGKFRGTPELVHADYIRSRSSESHRFKYVDSMRRTKKDVMVVVMIFGLIAAYGLARIVFFNGGVGAWLLFGFFGFMSFFAYIIEFKSSAPRELDPHGPEWGATVLPPR